MKTAAITCTNSNIAGINVIQKFLFLILTLQLIIIFLSVTFVT
nr:MAG TPA: hypothetical protein [Caudoviricetes sp.]